MPASKNSEIVRVAQMYYLQNMTQQEIAKEVGISRPTVSRLLDEARAQKIVEIRLNIKEEIDVDLSTRLRSLLKIPQVLVVSCTNSAPNECISQTAHAASEHLKSLLRDNMTLGVSWGRILKEIALSMPHAAIPGAKVVQIAGGLGGNETVFDGSEISYLFASRLQATYHPIFAPAVLPSREMANQFCSVSPISDALKIAENADLYLTGVGALCSQYDSSLQRAGYMDESTKKELIKKGAVAHIAGQIILSDGSELTSFNSRTVAIPLAKLREGNTICVTTSAIKAEAILACIRGGFIKTLICDKSCALEIQRLLNQNVTI